MNEYLEVFLRALVAIGVLLLFCRLVGARQISQLTFYDYVSGITLGSIAGTLCVDRDIPILYSVLAIAVFCVVTILIAVLTDKSIVLRRILTGSAHILIDNGKFVAKSLRMARFDINDVMRELRSRGYFSVSEIKYAILETNGQISIMPYAANRPVTNEDLGNAAQEAQLEANVVIDGKVMERNLRAMGRSKDWLASELRKQHADVKDVLLATLDTDGKLTLFGKGETCDHETIFE